MVCTFDFVALVTVRWAPPTLTTNHRSSQGFCSFPVQSPFGGSSFVAFGSFFLVFLQLVCPTEFFSSVFQFQLKLQF